MCWPGLRVINLESGSLDEHQLVVQQHEVGNEERSLQDSAAEGSSGFKPSWDLAVELFFLELARNQNLVNELLVLQLLLLVLGQVFCAATDFVLLARFLADCRFGFLGCLWLLKKHLFRFVAVDVRLESVAADERRTHQHKVYELQCEEARDLGHLVARVALGRCQQPDPHVHTKQYFLDRRKMRQKCFVESHQSCNEASHCFAKGKAQTVACRLVVGRRCKFLCQSRR